MTDTRKQRQKRYLHADMYAVCVSGAMNTRAYMSALCVSGAVNMQAYMYALCISGAVNMRAYMHEMCVSGAVNTQCFVWKFFYVLYIIFPSFVPSFIHSLCTANSPKAPPPPPP